MEEQIDLLIAMHPKDVIDITKPYTHCEIHPATMLGAMAMTVPFLGKNPSTRNTYQSAMVKQAIGIHSQQDQG